MSSPFAAGLVAVALAASSLGAADGSHSAPAARPSSETSRNVRAIRSDAIQDPRRIGLRAVGFIDLLSDAIDLSSGIPVSPAPSAGRAAAHRYFLVQYDAPPTRSEKERIRALGAEIVSHVRHHGMVVALPSDVALGDLFDRAAIRYAGPFLPAYRLDPRLRESIEEHGSREVTLRVRLFPGESPSELLRTLHRHLPSILRTRHVRPGGAGEPSRLLLDVPAGALEAALGLLLHLPAVSWVEESRPLELHNDDCVWTGQSYDRIHGPDEAEAPDPKPYAESATIWGHGLIGTGEIVAVADTGLQFDTCFWDDPLHPVVTQVVPPPGALAVDPDHRKILAVNGVTPVAFNDDGSFRHGTHVSATALGDDAANLAGGGLAAHDHGDGMAPGAKLIFEDISFARSASCSASVTVASVRDLLEQEYAAGARVSSNSWGSSDSRAEEVDEAVWTHEDLLVVFSAGNDGSSGIGPMAAFKNGVAVGATENYDETFLDEFGILDPENMAAFSSLGPAPDGRVKPDVVAPGYRVFSNRFPTEYHSNEAECDPGSPDVEVCFPSFGGCYFTFTDQTCSVNALSGTSMAAPAVAGLSALARQYFGDGFYPGGEATPTDALVPSAALIKAILLNGARNMTGHRYERRGSSKEDFGPLADAPSDVQGWGRVMLDDALYFAGDARGLKVLDVRNDAGLATGQTDTLEFSVVSPDEPLKLTLVWTDPPAPSYLIAALVNDLDLEIEAPDGTIYRGNQWTADDVQVPGDKASFPDPAGRDSVNNVEAILLPTPETGTYIASIRAVDVPGHQGDDTQGYALVVTGAVADPAGAVPDGANVPGSQLSVAKASGGQITLTWEASCRSGDADYVVHEGALGDFTSHAPRFCTTDGETTATFLPADGDRYYLVAPRSTDAEGSLGADSDGAERVPGPSACLPRAIGSCE